MHLSIVHDSEGTIVGLVASPPDAPIAHPSPRPGEYVTEVDAPDIDAELEDKERFGRLEDIIESYRIEISSGTLTRKSYQPG
jgi:hypothetical protein